ncbi:MAG: hypothetical protein ACU843_17675, partial [Gammaproteobacteria bacterium]
MNAPEEAILDLDGKPFRDFDRATAMRDLLVRETGRGYRIDRGDEDQFVVRRAVQEDSIVGQTGFEARSENRIGANEESGGEQDRFSSVEFQPIVLRPALRTSLPFALP